MTSNIRAALPLAALCLILFSGCSPAPTGTPAPTPAPDPPEPPLTDADLSRPVPDFLDEEQLDLYRHAFSAANFLMGCSTAIIEDYPRPDGSTVEWTLEHPHETYELDGATYLVAMGRYQKWDDFQAMMDGLFTPEYQKELLAPGLFASTEAGRLCFLEADRGSDLEYGWSDAPDSFVLVEQTEDAIDFNLVGHYAILDAGSAGGAVPTVVGEYTLEYPIRLEQTDLGWRVAEIHLPY